MSLKQLQKFKSIIQKKIIHTTDYPYFSNRSLERKLQRPLLAKSRTLPSIPQSPTVSRVHSSDLIGGSPPRRKNPSAASSSPKACTLPPAGKATQQLICPRIYLPMLDEWDSSKTAATDSHHRVTVCFNSCKYSEPHVSAPWTLSY